MRARGTKAVVVGTAVVMGCVALAGCGGDDGTGTTKPTAAASSSTSDGKGAQDRGTVAVRSAYARTAEAKTAKMTIAVKADADGKTVTTDGKGAIDLARGNSTTTLAVAGKTIEQRVVDQVLYEKLPGQKTPGGKPWIKIDLKQTAQQQGVDLQQIGDPAQSAAYAKAVTDKDVTKAGTEKIDGVDTTRYNVSIDVSKLPGGAQLREQLGPTLPMRMWLDDQGRIRRQEFTMAVKAPATATPGSTASPQQVRVSTVMGFSDFGTPVDVKAPPSTQVSDLTGQVPQGTRTQ
ncbi:hypothetical protein ABZ858_13870 [Streptomyces sp. NPDC047017]|uniref:DUF7537 family lipoprotein n=1 Tax=Streptomyces sp. NPDC047017 TaxID=3155024 RepID=UPI0033C2A705